MAGNGAAVLCRRFIETGFGRLPTPLGWISEHSEAQVMLPGEPPQAVSGSGEGESTGSNKGMPGEDEQTRPFHS